MGQLSQQSDWLRIGWTSDFTTTTTKPVSEPNHPPTQLVPWVISP